MHIIKNIINDISNLQFREPSLSIALVGSFVDRSHKIEKLNDLDFVLVFRKISTDLIIDIESNISSIIEKYSTDQIDIIPVYKIGPTKLQLKEKTQIMLHCLIYNMETLRNETPLVLYSWKKEFKHLSGDLHLDELITVNTISAKDVIYKPCGLVDCKNSIIIGKVGYFEWDNSKDNFYKKTLNLNGSDFVEFIFYSFFNSAKNALYAHGYESLNKSKVCENFEKEFRGLKSKKMLKEYMSLKKLYRTNQISLDNIKISNLKIDALAFLEELKQQLDLDT
jgi:uncharacterized protein (UPF0332 family)